MIMKIAHLLKLSADVMGKSFDGRYSIFNINIILPANCWSISID